MVLPGSGSPFGAWLGENFSDAITVGLVWEGPAAARAGMRAGQRVTSMNGVDTEFSCDGIRSALNAMSGETIDIRWDGGEAELVRETVSGE